MKKNQVAFCLFLIAIPQAFAYWQMHNHTKAENAQYEDLEGYLVIFTAIWGFFCIGLLAWVAGDLYKKVFPAIIVLIICSMVGCGKKEASYADKFNRKIHLNFPGRYGGKWYSGSAGELYRIISWKNGKSDTIRGQMNKEGGLMIVDSLKPDGRIYTFKDQDGQDSTFYSPDSIIIENIEP